MSSHLVPGLELRREGREKRKKLVWKWAVFKSVGVKGGRRCCGKVAAPPLPCRNAQWEKTQGCRLGGCLAGRLGGQFSLRESNTSVQRGIKEMTYEKHILPFFFLVYTNCACGAEWSGLGRLYSGTAHAEFSLYIYFSDPIHRGLPRP